MIKRIIHKLRHRRFCFEVPLVGKFLNNRKKGNPKITGVLDVSLPTRLMAKAEEGE